MSPNNTNGDWAKNTLDSRRYVRRGKYFSWKINLRVLFAINYITIRNYYRVCIPKNIAKQKISPWHKGRWKNPLPPKLRLESARTHYFADYWSIFWHIPEARNFEKSRNHGKSVRKRFFSLPAPQPLAFAFAWSFVVLSFLVLRIIIFEKTQGLLTT